MRSGSGLLMLPWENGVMCVCIHTSPLRTSAEAVRQRQLFSRSDHFRPQLDPPPQASPRPCSRGTRGDSSRLSSLHVSWGDVTSRSSASTPYARSPRCFIHSFTACAALAKTSISSAHMRLASCSHDAPCPQVMREPSRRPSSRGQACPPRCSPACARPQEGAPQSRPHEAQLMLPAPETRTARSRQLRHIQRASKPFDRSHLDAFDSGGNALHVVVRACGPRLLSPPRGQCRTP